MNMTCCWTMTVPVVANVLYEVKTAAFFWLVACVIFGLPGFSIPSNNRDHVDLVAIVSVEVGEIHRSIVMPQLLIIGNLPGVQIPP